MKVILKNRLFIWFALLSAIYLIFYSFQTVELILNSGVDDMLMYERAVAITNGKWLGQFNHATLSKGPIYSLWLVLLNLMRIPIMHGNLLLYMLSCIAVVTAIRPIINNKLSVLLYVLLLFNPVTISSEIIRLYRDSITAALCLFIIAWLIGVFVSSVRKLNHMLFYTVIGCVSLPSWWYIREDSAWISPLVICALAISAAVIICDKSETIKLRKSLLLIAPILCVVTTGLIFSGINYAYYGRFVVTDSNSKDIKSAYGALARITHENWIPDVPVPSDARQKAYELSPTFSRLEKYLDAEEDGSSLFEFYKSYVSNDSMSDSEQKDYKGGWFIWALRLAVTQECDSNPLLVKAFYESIAREVNEACDNGLVESIGKRTSTMPPFRSEYIEPTLEYFVDTLEFTIKMNNVTLTPKRISVNYDDTASFHLVREIERFINTNVLVDIIDPSDTQVIGWAFSQLESETPVQLEILDSNGNIIGSSVEWFDSPDVAQFFGNNYASANKCRFKLKFHGTEALGNYNIRAIDENGSNTVINLQTGHVVMKNKEVYACVDDVQLSTLFEDRLSEYDVKKMMISNFIYEIYKNIFYYGTLAALPVYVTAMIICSVLWIARRKYICVEKLCIEELTIMTGVLLIVLLRAGMLAYVHASMFHTMSPIYLSSVYPLVLLFNFLSFKVGWSVFRYTATLGQPR